MKSLLFFFLLIPQLIFCENFDSTKTKPHNYSFGIVYSTNVDYRGLKSNTANRPIVDYRNSTEIAKYGYNFGFNFLFHIHNRIVETGLQFSNQGFQTKDSMLYSPQPDPRYPIKSKNVYQYNYFEIPVVLEIPFAKGAWDMRLFNDTTTEKNDRRSVFFSTTGCSVDIFATQKARNILVLADGTKYKLIAATREPPSRLDLSLIAGFGMQHQFSSGLGFRFQVLFNMYILPDKFGAPVREFPGSLRFAAGLYF